MMRPIDAFGITGLFLLLLAFFLSSINKLKKNSYAYQLINFFGGIILATYGGLINTPIFMVLNYIWALVAFFSIIKKRKKFKLPETF